MAVTKFSSGSSFKNLTKYDDFLAGNAAYDPAGFVSIASAAGTGSSGTINFTSIPSTYKHLQIRVMARDTSVNATPSNITFRVGNGSIDTGSNYARHLMYADLNTVAVTASGNTASGGISITGSVVGGGTTAGIHGVTIIDIQNYASTSQNKTIRFYSGSPTGNTDSIVTIQSGLWTSLSAINTVQLLGGTNFATSSTFALYGIKGA